MLDKKMVTSVAGAAVGIAAAPFILDALNIPAVAGFGVDDIVTALIVVLGIMLVNQIF